MPQKTNLNVAPYYDDFDTDKNFYKVLFRPGFAIQGRELTQLQSLLQNQIEQFGKYAFKQGELVIPGEVGFNTKLQFVKLSSVSEIPVNQDGQIVYKKYDITQLDGRQVRGLTSGVVATVVSSAIATETTSDVMFVNYTNSGDAGNEETFRQGETLEVVNGVNTPLMVVGTDGSVLPTSISVTNPDTSEVSNLDSPAMGYASAVKVEEGIYFVNGYFVRNAAQLLIVNKYYDNPSAKVGFKIEEKIVTPEEDSSLYDNSIGSSNYSAPGAHRLSINLTLVSYDLDQKTDNNFIKLLSIKNGSIQSQVSQTDYNLLEQTLARRTYDESGDYVVDNFSLDVREYRQKDGNLGVYAEGADGTYNGLTEADADSKLIASIGPGKAYVKGYEIVNKETKYVPVNKARETLNREDIRVKTKGLPTYSITNTFGSIPLNAEGSELTAYPDVYLSAAFNDGSLGLNDTEAANAVKQTLSRRGTFFDINQGIKTIYLAIENNYATTVAGLTGDNFVSEIGNLWFVQARNTDETPSVVNTVSVISFARVPRIEINSDPTVTFLELTITAQKDYLDNFMIEYDEGDANKKRYLYYTKSDAQTQGSIPFGTIVDYNETITPVVGITKPSNFTLTQKGSGFNIDTDVVASKGRLANGDATYNTTFSLSYFDPTFFTKILLDAPITAAGSFTPGQYIYGLTSGAYGVVEGTSTGVYTAGKTLMVKGLFGNFRSGEVIVDEGGNSIRIAKDNTISHFISNERGANYVSGTTLRINGVIYDDSKISVGLDGSGGIFKINIVNRDAVSVEYSKPPLVEVIQGFGGGNPSAAVITPILVRNAVTTYTPQNVKSFYSEFGSGNANTFTSDIEINREQYADLVSVTDFTFTGYKGRKYIECNGFGGNASTYLQHGDLVQFTDDSGELIRAIVQQATIPAGVDKSRVYFDRSLPENVTNTTVVRVRPKISNFNQGTLLYKTGSSQVSSIVADSEDSKIKYYLRRDFVSTGAGGEGKITFAAQLPFGTQRFVSFSESNFIVTVLDAGAAPNIVDGDIVYITQSQVEIKASTDAASGLTSGSVKLSLPADYFGTIPTGGTYPTLKLTATLEVSKAKPRLKTANINKRIIIESTGDRVIPFRGRDYDTESLNVYSYSDAFRLRYVYEGSPTEPPTVDRNGNLVNGVDITNRFTFDDGQRDTIYDISRIVIKPGFNPPSGQLVVAFDYFDHTAGDFCTVDSYLHEAGVGGDEIPSFNSPTLGKVSLKDVLDFRPKIDNDAIVSGFQNKSILSAPNNRSYTGTGGVVASTPAPDKNLEYTFSFTQTQYLDRIDGVFLNKKGQFIVKEGNSSLNPSKPDPISDAIALYYMYIPAFTQTSKDVRITTVDNRRYTMRDIGKLEKRIERLEYYTTLSILEQQALNMQVVDPSGFNRFKSGFIVDNFESHKIGSLRSLDYRCAIDTQQSVLRPQSREDSFGLKEMNTRDDQRSVSGYQRSGDVVTLPYSQLELLGNNFATKTLNPNPFVVLQYVGDSFIGPAVDTWYDTSVAPLVTDNNTNLYSIFLAKEELLDSFSSLHNSYQINWIGANQSFFNIGSFADVNSNVADSSVTSASVGSSSNISPQNNEIGKGLSTKGVGSNVIATSLSFFARSIPVKFVINRLKPNTRVYVFMEGRDISRWVNPDLKYTGIAGNSLSAFNGTITTDSNGNASGIILVPAGKPPRENAIWTGNVDTVSYDSDASEIRFTAGVKTIRFTSSASDAPKEQVETFAEVKFYATGALPENPSSIVSTKPAFFKSNEGTQIVDSNTENPIRPNPFAQTFKVEGFDGGVFVTSVDLFFNKKSDNIPLRVYLTDVISGKPGKNIIPGTQKVLTPETFLKVVASDTLTINRDELVTGGTSNASGPISRVIDKNNIEVSPSTTGVFTLANDQVYTLVLSNNNGKSFVQDEALSVDSIAQSNAANNTQLSLRIAKDSGRVTGLKVKSTGSNYDSAIITIESPQLPGGGNATAIVRVSGGKVYHTEINLQGSGYTEPPAIVLRGTGNGNAGAVIESEITIDTPAVRMGIAIDEEGQTQSITPTNFKFDNPVYLENDTEYAMAIETDSIDYELWGSRLGETEIATSQIVTTQPLLGSLFKSQNSDSWTEDLFEDIKFRLHRAEFDISRTANLMLTNEDLGYELLEANPIETNAESNTTATSSLFKNNNQIVKVSHRDNGFDSGNSYVFFKSALDVGGITASQLNSNLYQITNHGVDSYNITSGVRASGNAFGGGTSVLASYNRKFEKLFAAIPNLTFSQTKIDSFIKTTNISPVDDNVNTFASYSQTDFERTFLNEDFFFINQKIVASKINETINNINNSLVYKLDLSSSVSYLSPVIDLSRASVKTITNRVENPLGREDRYGRRDQVLSFYSVYSMSVVGVSGNEVISLDQRVTGGTTKAEGVVVKVDGSTVFVKITSVNTFVAREELSFSSDTFANAITVGDTGVTKFEFEIPNTVAPPTYITGRNPSVPAQTYDNTITGKIVLWDADSVKLTIVNDKQPLNDDYTGRIIDSQAFTRNASVDAQLDDIFRVGDLLSYPNQPEDEARFIEVSGVEYTTGVDFIAETQSKNSSGIAKYVTKEVAIDNPATSINIKLTANVSDIENLKVLYKIKKSSSQENFEDIEWAYFNETGNPDNDLIASSENAISGITEKQSSYQELSYSIENLPEFSSFAVKIVMKSSNPAFVPKIQDMRAVASY
jgi:hypothetical protein